MLALFLFTVPALMAVSPNPEPALNKDKQTIKTQSSVSVQENSPYDEKVKELAVMTESLLSSAMIEPQYEDEYLKNTEIPVSMRDNFKKRYRNSKEISKLKEARKAKEKGDGYLESDETASVDERDKVKAENSYREELYSLIVSYFNMSEEKDKSRVPAVYSDVILNIKDYTLSDTPELANKQNGNVIASIATSYKYDMVKDVLFKTLKDLNLGYDEKERKKFNGSVTVKYKCSNGEDRAFLLKLCQIKDGTLVECKNSGDNALYSTISDGNMLWVEKGENKEKTLVIPDTRSEDQRIKLCPKEDLEFSFLERLSNMLIEEEELAKLRAEEEKKRKEEEAKKKAKAKKDKDKKKKNKEKDKKKNKKKKK